MIEHNGVLIHVDLKEDRRANARFRFEGWVAAVDPIAAVWLPATGRGSLPLSARPDVQRIFPTRTAVGFSGEASAGDLGTAGLRIAVRIGDAAFEVEHPLPAPLPELSFGNRLAGSFRLGWLAFRARLTRHPVARWRFVLRRHLMLREQRSGVFHRRHTDALLSDFAIAMPEAVFLQIGANDGKTGDPLYPLLAREQTRWSGVLVEPVAHLFAQLEERYRGNPAVRLERAAISEADGTAVMHRWPTSAADSLWLDQLPSLAPEILQQNAQQFSDANKAPVAETVPSYSVRTLLARHQMERLDLLVIDTEGWDWRILRQFDLAALKPELVLYEHQHLSADERPAAHEMLARCRYGWAETPEGDTLAWRLP